MVSVFLVPVLTQYSLAFYYSYFCLQSPLLRSQRWWRRHVRTTLLIPSSAGLISIQPRYLQKIDSDLHSKWWKFPQSSQIGVNIIRRVVRWAHNKLWKHPTFQFRASKSAWTPGQGGTWQQYLPIFDFLNGFSWACTIDQSPNIMSVYPEGGTEVDWFYPTSQNELILKDSTFCLRDPRLVDRVFLCVCVRECEWVSVFVRRGVARRTRKHVRSGHSAQINHSTSGLSKSCRLTTVCPLQSLISTKHFTDRFPVFTPHTLASSMHMAFI